MTTDTTKLKAKLASLTASLDGLESTLAPLFEQTLPETTLVLAPIEQAKLQTLLPYIVYDLVFIYLKSKGIDPKTHPVIEELTRVRKYFGKISSAENPETQRAPIDKAAATRFIKHAITQSKIGESSADSMPQETAPSTFVPVKVTSKMLARAEHEAELRARGDTSSEEEELEIIDADDDVPVSGKGKGKAKEVVEEPASAGSKRRRPDIDHFAGFGDEPKAVQVDETNETEKKRRKKEQKKAKDEAQSDSIEEAGEPDAAQTDETDELEKKKQKKEKKKVKGESTQTEDTVEPEKKKRTKAKQAKKGDGNDAPSPKKKAKK
ncbi:Sas10/Utp3/C1D family-domain-containing protein [Mycena sanguinolenta]|nr:Sas10/Utp3/C1D family-domain-containing protein [Mycena sanguinolenta]